MHRRYDFRRNTTFSISFLATALVLLLPDLIYAQGPHDMVRGGGGYLSPWKLAAILVPFLIWVRYADWINRDSMKLGDDTGMHPEVWNPINVLTFLIGFFAAISLPMFIAGYPLFLVATFAGPVTYSLIRRGKMKSNPGLKLKAGAKGNEAPAAPLLPQDEGAAVEFVAAGADENERQVNLIRSRQTPEEGYKLAKDLIDDNLKRRADSILMDYTREHVVGKTMIDGFWHNLEPMDRVTGDGMLATLKFLAGLNPADRRSKQFGTFRAITPDIKCDMELTTLGTKTGERIQLKFNRIVKHRLNINQLGMWPETSAALAEKTNNPGLVIVSAKPTQGLTSTWQAVLANSDRITRDAVAVIDANHTETDIENITVHRFDKAAGQAPIDVMKPILLTQPDAVIVPEVVNSETLDKLVAEANQQERSIITQVNANSAAEALLKLYSVSKDRRGFAEAVTAVTNQRLMRRLCSECKVTVQVQPKMIQQLGGDPRKQNTICNQYRLPPPEQRVDENGKPIEMLPCSACSGIGFIGRIAVFETLFVNQAVRQALLKTPNVAAIEKAARSGGKLPLISEAYKLVLLGLTSIQEVQRVMKD